MPRGFTRSFPLRHLHSSRPTHITVVGVDALSLAGTVYSAHVHCGPGSYSAAQLNINVERGLARGGTTASLEAAQVCRML